MVGNGPAVSVGDTVQAPDVVLVVVVLASVTVSFLQASVIIGTVAAPMRKCFRNFFLDCSMVLVF